MAGQVRVTIAGRQWLASLTNTYWELVQGLGGVTAMEAETGMLFDLGGEQSITVTTQPMLFSLDIAFLSETLAVTEVYRNVPPGCLVRSTIPARYFLEVNAGELADVESGDQVAVEILSLQEETSVPDWVPAFTSFTMFLLVGFFLAGTVKILAQAMSGDCQRASLLCESSKEGRVGRATASSSRRRTAPRRLDEGCQKVSPRDYGLLSWVGAPIPDYSFAVEPETKERKIDDVLKRLREGVETIQQGENFREFLLTMSKFHDYSIGNLMLIMLQKKDATRVAGFNTWKDLGRWVNKGEKGIAILAPCMPPKGTQPATPKEPTTEEGETPEEPEVEELRPVYFKVVYVFDVSQTEGKPLPEFEVPVLTGEANPDLFERALRLAKAQGLDVSFDSRPQQDPDIKGMYWGKNIWVRPEEPPAQQLKTLLHEVAHYYSEGVFQIPRRDAETIAESAAFTVGAHFGFDTGTRSFSYVALWSQDKKILERNLASIRKVSDRIIDALETSVNKPIGVA
ncbi:MAG: DUF192 domain-containing protein [Dehalococcoidia bacterium]|nr:DUF192 domain-containing protein [Dehalococcoidia bacterium]